MSRLYRSGLIFLRLLLPLDHAPSLGRFFRRPRCSCRPHQQPSAVPSFPCFYLRSLRSSAAAAAITLTTTVPRRFMSFLVVVRFLGRSLPPPATHCRPLPRPPLEPHRLLSACCHGAGRPGMPVAAALPVTALSGPALASTSTAAGQHCGQGTGSMGLMVI